MSASRADGSGLRGFESLSLQFVILMDYKDVISELRSVSNADPSNLERMYTKFGVDTKNALGIPIPMLRHLAKGLGVDHRLALRLWSSKIHEAMELAAMIEDPKFVTQEQMESWVRDFHSWDVCDGCCANLFVRTPFAYKKAVEWSKRNEEFIKRAGFVLMALLAVHDKAADDKKFERFLPLIKKGSSDGRNFVKKAVNWALRQIGKKY